MIMKCFFAQPHRILPISMLIWIFLLLPLILSCGAGKGNISVDGEGPLWSLANPKQVFNIVLNPDKLDYNVNDNLIMHLRSTNDTHIIILNWDSNGKLSIVFPNDVQTNNFTKADITRTVPNDTDDFDITLADPIGTERYKVIALRNSSDSNAIVDLFPKDGTTILPVTNGSKMRVEAEVSKLLRKIDSKDWSEDSKTVVKHPVKPAVVELTPVTREMFFTKMSTDGDVIIDAGALGVYRFTAEAQTTNVPQHIIRQELVDLLNKVQLLFKETITIEIGYRSPGQHIYQWAKWMQDHPQFIATLNAEKHTTWESWVKASQRFDGCPPLKSKHQTGEAVSFVHNSESIHSNAGGDLLVEHIREVGGTREYSAAERKIYDIPNNHNYLFNIVAIANGQNLQFNVEYVPSQAPQMPSLEQIGELVSIPEPERKIDLWSRTNPLSSFNIMLTGSSTSYHVGGKITFQAESTENAYILLLNWDQNDALTVLMPNRYRGDNFVRAETTYTIPSKDDIYKFKFFGPPGTERYKIIGLLRIQDNRNILDILKTKEVTSTTDFWSWEGDEAKNIAFEVSAYLDEIASDLWSETSYTAKVHEAAPPDDPGPPIVNPPDFGKDDIVYLKDQDSMYFGKVTEKVGENAKTVTVDIYNEHLKKKLGSKVPIDLILGKRTEPPRGWGIHKVMLSAYLDGKWVFTTDVVVYKTYYLLPEQINGVTVEGSREVGLGEVRIPAPTTPE